MLKVKMYLNVYVVNCYLSKIYKKYFCEQFGKIQKFNKHLQFENVGYLQT